MRQPVAWSIAATAVVVVTLVLATRATDRLELLLRDAALRALAPLPALSTRTAIGHRAFGVIPSRADGEESPARSESI